MAHLQYPYVNYFSSFLFFFSFLENFIRDITFLPSDYGPHREKSDSLNQGEGKNPLRDRSETLRQKSPIKEEGKKRSMMSKIQKFRLQKSQISISGIKRRGVGPSIYLDRDSSCCFRPKINPPPPLLFLI